MNGKTVFKIVLRYIFITFTAFLYAVGISLFLNPNNLAPGGVSGVAIILKELFPMLPGIGFLIFIINIPIMIVGAWKFGFKFIISTFYALVASSTFIDVIPMIFQMDAVTKEPMLAAVIGGSILGLGIGLMFRLETTTGGMDILVKLVKQKKPYLRTGQIYMIMDAVILVASALAFHNVEVALFAAIAIYVSAIVMDRAIYGGDEATLVYIISDKRKIIAVRMMQELEVGVTLLQGMGAYSTEQTEVIMCVMRKQTLVKVRNLLKEVDSKAFMIVSSAKEVFGEGFKDQFKAEL